jgi:hypothetical protein
MINDIQAYPKNNLYVLISESRAKFYLAKFKYPKDKKFTILRKYDYTQYRRSGSIFFSWDVIRIGIEKVQIDFKSRNQW